jgi:hypothetical protein
MTVTVSPYWLRLREPADAAARSTELVERLRRHLPATRPIVVHDLGAGSGAMGRWLAPRLPGPQHWVLHDRDPALLELAVGDGVEVRESDITRLEPADLEGADLIVASALLDMLTADELTRMLTACRGLPMLLALTVTGGVALAPSDPLDARFEAAFNDHQRRGTLGPDAVGAAIDGVRGTVVARPSPWHLDAAHAELIAEWFGGWVAAACEQEPALAAEAGAYGDWRLTQAFEVTLDHADLLVLP